MELGERTSLFVKVDWLIRYALVVSAGSSEGSWCYVPC